MMTECPHCGTSKVERNGYCATYNREKRKIESMPPPKEFKPIRKVSPQRAVENKEYARLRRDYLEAYPVCEVVECHRKSTQIHHMAGRSNELLNNVDLFLAVCDICHQRIHAEPI